VLLRALIWQVFTGEPVLLSKCRELVAFLKEPLEDEAGKTFESPYKDEPMTGVAAAVVKAIDPMDEEDLKAAQAALNGIDPNLLPAGEREYWIAIAHWSAGEWVPAEAQMKRSVGMADSPHHRFGLARVLDLGGKDTEALAAYHKVIADNPDHIAAKAYAMLLELAPEADATAAIETFFTENQGTVPARIASDLTLVLADTYCLRGEEPKARKVIQQAKVNDPGYKLLLHWAPPAPPAPEPVEG